MRQIEEEFFTEEKLNLEKNPTECAFKFNDISERESY